MHQSIPAAPNPPPPPHPHATTGHLHALSVDPWGGAFANFALPEDRAFANPGAVPQLLPRTRFSGAIDVNQPFLVIQSNFC